MALSEAQIVRYSRQILLKEVGGEGQLRLLRASLRCEDPGAATGTAAAYVAAGGGSVEPPQDPPAPGFVTEWRALSQDHLSAGDSSCMTVLGAVLGEVAAGAHQVLVGADEVVFAAAGTCADCLRNNVPLQSDRAEAPDLLGALAALVHQRFALGLERGAGRLCFSTGSGLSRQPLQPCAGCRS